MYRCHDASLAISLVVLEVSDENEKVDDARSVVDLLILIQDLQYNKTDRKRSIMATVQADFDLYTCAQKANQSTDEYYKVFTSTVDTINANGGQAGLHPSVYQRHPENIIAKDLVKSNINVAALDDAAKKALPKPRLTSGPTTMKKDTL